MDAGIVIPKEAKMKYVERRKKDLEALRSAFAGKDFSEFKKVGHQLKGNSSTFGFMDLEVIGKELEVAGLAEDVNHAASLLEQFEQWISRTSAAMAE